MAARTTKDEPKVAEAPAPAPKAPAPKKAVLEPAPMTAEGLSAEDVHRYRFTAPAGYKPPTFPTKQ